MNKFKRAGAVLIAALILVTIFTVVPLGSVSAAVSQAAKVKGTDVNIRSGPSTDYSSLGTVSNVDLYVTGMNGEWFSVTYNGISGYIHYPYITFVPTAIVPQSANLTANGVNMRSEASLKHSVVVIVPYATSTITVTGIVYVGSTVWYETTYNGYSGYIKGNFVKLSGDIQYPQPDPEPEPDPDFEVQLLAFPESYRPYLRTLHAKYPNWVFRADNLAMSYSEAVAGETADWQTKLVNYSSDGVSWRSLAEGAYNWDSGTWNKTSGNWVTASREVVMYYMDPRNFLNETDIYMFLKQGYDTSQTADGVAATVANSFLANGYSDPDDTAYGGSYINVIMAAAQKHGVSPYVLAATILLEQGRNGTSDLISGNTAYGKYFNFFNIKASGDTQADVIANGLNYAISQGWNTRSASIIGGASFYAKGYISSGQDTYFYKNFDLLSAPYYSHQYAQSIYDSRSSAKLIRDIYMGEYNTSAVFRIPVYTSIPETVAEKPVENDLLNNYYLLSMSVDGFSMYNYYYSLSVSGDRVIDVTLPEGASLVSNTPFELSAGTNSVVVTVRAQTGYTNSYYLTVTADRPCKLYVSPCAGSHTHSDWHIDTPAGNYTQGIKSRHCTVCGITTDTAAVEMLQPLTALTLVNVRREILLLSGNFDADVNGDGVTDVLDLIRFKKMLTEK